MSFILSLKRLGHNLIYLKGSVTIMKLDLKSKLFFLTALPIVVIFILSIGRVIYDFDQKQKLKVTKEHIVEAKAFSRVIHFMQTERGLSSGFVAKNSANDVQSLAKARRELDRAIEYASSVHSFKEIENIDFSYIASDIKLRREKIDAFGISASEVRDCYTKHIDSLLDFAKSMPTMIDEREDRNLLQAYSYLGASKESLGQIRAILNEVFITNNITESNLISASEELHNYKNASDRFEKTLFDSNEVMRYYRKSLKSDAPEETFKIIDTALKGKESANFGVDASYWFEQATKTIDLLKEIEDKLFETLDKTVDAKIDTLTFNMTLILVLLILVALGILLFSAKTVRKILSVADKFNEEFEDSLMLLEQYKATVDKAFVVSKTNPKGVIQYANDEFCKISGYTKEELISKPHNIVRHPDMPKETFKEMWHTIKELKQPWSGEVKNLAKDGSSYWMRAYINPILDKEDNVIEYIAMRADISEIQEEKERIRDTLGISVSDYAEARHLANEYENAMSATWSIIRTDPNNKITYMSHLQIQSPPSS